MANCTLTTTGHSGNEVQAVRHGMEARRRSLWRRLWASTGVKNPGYHETMYVDGTKQVHVQPKVAGHPDAYVGRLRVTAAVREPNPLEWMRRDFDGVDIAHRVAVPVTHSRGHTLLSCLLT